MAYSGSSTGRKSSYSGKSAGSYSGLAGSYGAAGTVNYSSNLTITSPSGHSVSYSQSLSIPYTPSVNYRSALLLGASDYGKSISDIVQPYAARSAGKANQSSKYPLDGLRNSPYSLDNKLYDGPSHTDGYSQGQSLRVQLLDKYLRSAENAFGESAYRIKQEEEEVKDLKKPEDGIEAACVVCGKPTEIGTKLCASCSEKMNYRRKNGKNNWN
jgi:hypothetical protein